MVPGRAPARPAARLPSFRPPHPKRSRRAPAPAPAASAAPTSAASAFRPLQGPAVWYGAELARDPSGWTRVWTPEEIDELEAAVRAVAGRDLATLQREDVPLPGLQATLADARREVLEGRGFVLFRGLPVERWGIETSAAAYYALGLHLGEPVSQNGKGHVLGHVKDIGGDPSKPETRIYTTSAAQPFHTDSCDVVGLLCLRKAQDGGLSNVCSSATVYNEVLARRPDLLEVLCDDFLNDRKGEVPEGKLPHFSMPIFCHHAGHVSSMFDRSFISAAQARFPDVPRLSPQQIEALDLAEEVCSSESVRLDMQLEPGDIQLLHNHQLWHARSEYNDHPDPTTGLKRHLLRLWLSVPDGRELPPVFAERYGNIELGTRRGGINLPGLKLVAPLEAE